MATVSTYLNFNRTTEEAFTFYKQVFGAEFIGGITYMGDIPPMEGMPPLAEEDRQLVMNVQLPITGGHILMGTDVLESMGTSFVMGNNVSICVQPDTRADADTLFAALAEGGVIEMPLAEMFWGDYYGSFVDKFGVQWMISTSSKE